MEIDSGLDPRYTFRQIQKALRLPTGLPLRLMPDGAEAFLVAHLEDLLKIRIHRIALTARQVEPSSERVIRLGVL